MVVSNLTSSVHCGVIATEWNTGREAAGSVLLDDEEEGDVVPARKLLFKFAMMGLISMQ